jgi:hypothetical protein
MAVTRIKNNQITDSTITFQKIASGTLVGSLFNANLTLNSNVNINGNLSIAGNTTTINSIDTLVSDSLLTLNAGYVGIPSYDVGILFNRALGTLGNYGGVNAALVWSESDGAFIVVLTTETGTTAGTINRAFQANMIVGNLTVSNTVTAQTATVTTLNVTNTNVNGLTSTGNIVAASGTVATNYTTGAIVVPGGGGVGITGDLWVQGPSTFAGNIVAGNIVLSGNINVPVGGTFSNTGVFFGNAGGIGALYAGTSTYTALPTTVLQMSGNVDSYAQVNFQNINSGASASTDFVLTADNGDDNDGYINLGINSSTFDDPAFAGYYPNDGYLIMHGLEPSTGNLNIHSHNQNSVIKLIVGGFSDANIRATVSKTGFRVNTATASASTTSGALIVDGGVGIGGNIHAAAINATPVGNTTPSTGNFTSLTATNSQFTTLVVTNFSSGNAVISGGYISALTNASIIDATVTNLNSTNANATTLVATNFSTANAVITGGSLDAISIGATTPSTGNFTTANATSFTGYTATIATVNSTNGNITTVNTTTVNADTTTSVNINTTNGNVTTLVAANFSTANAQITGGYIDGAPIGPNTASTGNFTTANANSVTAYTVGATTLNSTTGNVTTLYAQNFSTANAIITGGNITIATGNGTAYVQADRLESFFGQMGNLSVGNIQITAGNATLLNGTISNLISSNATITGGNIDATPIGFNTPSTGSFTTLSASGSTTFTDSTESDNPTVGAVVVTGGLGVGANLNVGGNLTVLGNLTVIGNTTTLNTESLNVEDLNITVAANATTGLQADGAGLTVAGANATLTYVNAIDSWQVNKPFAGFGITMFAGNFTSANITTLTSPTVDATTATIATLNSTLANITTGNINTINSANGNITTLVATNFSTANAVITGGSLDAISIGATTPSTGNFTTANATSFTGYSATIATINTTTGNVTNLNSATIDAGTTTAVNLNTTNGNATTLIATNFSTANAVITGGSLDAISIGATTPSTGNFTTANATTVTAYTVTGTTVNTTNGNTTTLVATNFSTANAQITGGFADNFPIGANTASTVKLTPLVFTTKKKPATLNATSNVYLSPQTGPATVTINPLNGGTVDSVAIGSVNAANVYASNFRAATSLNVAPTGPVWIRGGTGTSGINNIPIGAVTPSSGVFTTLDGQTLTGTTVNATNGNVTTLVTTNFSSGNAVISGGYVSALSNAYITLSQITNFSTGNARITGGFADNFPIGANTAATGAFTTLTAASLNGTIIGNATPAAGTFTELVATANLRLATGNIVISSGNTTVYTAAAGVANTTGALVITGTGGAAINGNMYVGQGVVINGNKSTHDTIIRGVSENSLVFVVADSVYDQVSIGGNITTANITQGAKLVVNSTDAMLVPVGSSAQRPGSVGFTDVDGMLRFNNTTNALEFYGDGQWNTTGSTFTTILSRTFSNSSGDLNGNVDGINTQFTLASNSTTAGTLVSISGVLQVPTTAYTVSGNVVVFTEAPAIGDIIDTRIITTTQTVTGISSLSGFNQFVTDDTALRFYTGNISLGTVENWRMDTHGDFYPVTTSNIGTPTNRVDYFFGSNINLSGGSITGATVSSGSLDDTVIGANVARLGSFTSLFANGTFTTNAEHVTDDIRGKYVAPGGTDAVYGFATATYRSGKFFVQLSDESGGEYQAAEVIAVQNGTTMSIEVYGVTFTGAANLATFSSNISAGTAYLNASSAGANLKIKVTPTLMKI